MFEIMPVFIMGLSVFVFILLMFQSFKLSEYIIINGAKLDTMMRLVFYMMLGYLPILFPIALLFAVLMVYGRLSEDSEIAAFKSLGLSNIQLTIPALIVGLGVSFLSLESSFRLAPWGQKNFDELINLLSQTAPGAAIREGVFSEGFFDLVVFTNKVDAQTGQLENVFIYDERDPDSPITIISQKGQLVNSNNLTQRKAYLRLLNGNLHKSSNEYYTKIDFHSYDINLYDPHDVKVNKATPDAMNFSELETALKSNKYSDKEKTDMNLIWHRRLSLAAVCFIFAFLGVTLGMSTNRRAARSGSIVICVSVVVIYWTIFVTSESLARSGKLPPYLSAVIANMIFLIFSMYHFRRSIQQQL